MGPGRQGLTHELELCRDMVDPPENDSDNYIRERHEAKHGEHRDQQLGYVHQVVFHVWQRGVRHCYLTDRGSLPQSKGGDLLRSFGNQR